MDKKSSRPVSVALGINLDDNLRPMEATIISINDRKYTSASFFNRLFINSGENESFKGITELRSEYAKSKKLKFNEFLEKENLPMPQIDSTSLQMILISDLHRLIDTTTEPVVSVVERYNNLRSNFLIRLKAEISFYLGAVRLINILRKSGLPICRPEAASMEERIFNVEGLYNLQLALRMHRKNPNRDLSSDIVVNDLEMGENGRIFILTGPNSGGKITYIQAVAFVQLLFQVGLYVPAVKARISPVDNIYTHFPVEEKTGVDMGRLDEESKRLNDIFKRASRYSMIILNESFSRTSPGESLYLSKDIICALRYLGARGVFATHLHELGMDVENINRSVEGDSLVGSLVAGVASSGTGSTEPAKRTYKVVPGKPQGLSYAKDIARQFGISYEQLEEIIKRNRELHGEAEN